MRTCIYLDNAATTFPKPEKVYVALDKANRELAVNAGRGSYALAKQASEIIAETKNEIKKLANTDDVAEVVFTASATLACNQIFGGLDWKKEDVVYVSPYEHNAVMRVLYGMQKRHGFEIEELAIDEATLQLDFARVEYQFSRKAPTMVVMSHVSNVLGYVIPIAEISKLAKTYQALVVVDGAQALGVVPVDLRSMQIDFYVFAGHKTLYGPFGIGGFVNCSGKKLLPFLAGGTGSDSLNLEMDTSTSVGLEPGSPNIVAIAGLLAALRDDERDALYEMEQELTAYFIEQLSEISCVKVYRIADVKQQVGIVAFNIEGYQAAEVGMILDEDYHIAVRTGYQCAPLIHEHLHSKEYVGVVRASMGRFTTKEELDCLIRAVREITEG